jgi:hypothetical protein
MRSEPALVTASIARSPANLVPMAVISLLMVAGLTTVFFDGLKQMVGSWNNEEYSYAYLVPLISAWLIWQKRAVIAKGLSKQLVYYWFQQRGRHMTNEYVVKWMIFWDALTQKRTDGALVRLVTSVPEGTDISAADARLAAFMLEIHPLMQAYIPD